MKNALKEDFTFAKSQLHKNIKKIYSKSLFPSIKFFPIVFKLKKKPIISQLKFQILTDTESRFVLFSEGILKTL